MAPAGSPTVKGAAMPVPAAQHGSVLVARRGDVSLDLRRFPGDVLLAGVTHLYACRGLSVRRVAALLGVSRRRVAEWLHDAGVEVPPRGAGRRRPERRAGEPANLRALLVELYVDQRRSAKEVGVVLGMPERRVRDRLHEYGLRARTRGRCDREDRRALPAELLGDLYVRAGLSADEVGRRVGVSRAVVLRSAHDLGLPVRAGGLPAARAGPSEIELVEALYADPLVRAALLRHDLPRVPAGAPIWERFPVPVPLSGQLADELYRGCGLSSSQIELLTGQPSQTVRRVLRDAGVALRPPGGRSPFLRRWRAGHAG
jgi:transposase